MPGKVGVSLLIHTYRGDVALLTSMLTNIAELSRGQPRGNDVPIRFLVRIDVLSIGAGIHILLLVGQLVGVVCPYAEAPLLATDEVGVVIRQPEVVDLFVLARVLNPLDRPPLPVLAVQHVTDLQLRQRRPALRTLVERMFRRRP